MTTLRMIGPNATRVQAGCIWPITILGKTGLVRKGFRKFRHKLTLILPISWRVILSDLIEKFLESFSRRCRRKQQSMAAVGEEMSDAI
jgi:hypothetical protein